MIKKSTLILMLGFLVIFSLAVLIEKSPQVTTRLRTPTPTAYLKLISDWNQNEINQIEIIQPNQKLILTRDPNLGWVLQSDQKVSINQDIVDTNLSNIIAMDILSIIAANQLNALGLDPSSSQITLHGKSGLDKVIRIGKETPTGSGYYLVIDKESPVVISKNEVEEVLNNFQMEKITQSTPPTTITP